MPICTELRCKLNPLLLAIRGESSRRKASVILAIIIAAVQGVFLFQVLLFRRSEGLLSVPAMWSAQARACVTLRGDFAGLHFVEAVDVRHEGTVLLVVDLDSSALRRPLAAVPVGYPEALTFVEVRPGGVSVEHAQDAVVHSNPVVRKKCIHRQCSRTRRLKSILVSSDIQ